MSKIIINAGTQQKIQVGFDGIVAEPNGTPVGVFAIKVVDQDKSLAEVKGLGRDISNYAVAIINKPK